MKQSINNMMKIYTILFLSLIFSLSVFGQNNPPVAVNDTFTTLVNTPLNGYMSINDSDIDGDNLTYSLLTPAVNGLTPIDPIGGFTYIPNPNFIGQDSFQYLVCDDGTPILCDSAMVYINVIATISNVVATNITDCGLTDGTIDIQTNTNTNLFEYSIDNGITFTNNNTHTNLLAGSYDIIVREISTNILDTFVNNPVIITTPITPIITNITTTNPTVCGGSDGLMVINTIGTNLEYSINNGFSWQSTNTFTGLAVGSFDIIIRNINGTCAIPYINNPVIINAPIPPVITNVNSTDPTNCGVTDGTITISALNGSGSLQYSIDSGLTWQTANQYTGLAAGSYDIAVSNADTTCIQHSIQSILASPTAPIITSVIHGNSIPCNTLTGSITINTNAINYEYSIDGGANWQTSYNGGIFPPTGNLYETFNGLSCGTYYVSVRNVDGTCQVDYINNPVIITDSIYPTQNRYDTIAIGATHQLCLPNNLVGTSASLTNVCGTIPNVAIDSIVGDCLYLYADNYGSATTCFVRCDNFGYCDTTYLHFTVIDGVWPGDADDNTIVNNFDLLNIGLGYGTTGTIRDSISNRWNGFVTPLWNQATPTSNIDYRHLDCNGDGIINSDDTTAIVQNYNLSYQRGGGDGNTGTPLAIQIDPNFTLPHFSLPITLGNNINPAVDVYGGAFSILYDTTLIKKDSVFITFNNAWVGTNNVDMISLSKNFGNQQQIDVAFTRIDGTNITGFGEIGQLNFTIKDDILQRSMTVDSVIFNFNIVNTKFISFNEQEIDIATESTSWVVTGTSNIPNLDKFVKVFPNPTKEFVQIESSSLPISNIIITDAIGRIVLQKTPKNQYNTALDIHHLKQGVYNIQLKTERGILVKRLIVLE